MESIKRGGYASPSIKVGDVFVSNFGLEYEVVEYLSYTKQTGGVKVRFTASGHEAVCNGGEVRAGEVKDPTVPSVCGVGIVGVGRYKCASGGKKSREYVLWHNMLKRCYEDNHPSYKGKEVCSDWHNFQNFAEWCYETSGFTFKSRDGRLFCLDKDLLVANNKVYCPSNCCFLPNEINTVLIGRERRTDLPCGVYTKRGCLITHEYLDNGSVATKKHNTIEAASLSYKIHKLERLRNLANIYKSVLPERVYEALVDFDIDLRQAYN